MSYAGSLMSLMLVMASPPQDPVRDTIPHFPVIKGSSLTRQKVSLPADFGGELNVVLIAFKRGQQADVDSWTPALRAIADTLPRLRVYELPVLPRSLSLMRSFIDGGMRGGIPDSAVRATTIPLYINKTPFKQALGIASEDSITVILVDRTGAISWQARGTYDATALASLTAHLATLSRRAPPGP